MAQSRRKRAATPVLPIGRGTKPPADLDPVYFDSSYYLYPDGPVAVEMLRVIGAAMAEAGVVGLAACRTGV